ncbi:MAG: hypothetical protein HRT40_00135 [Campylobacteraceae bacterium]|nr:hypothetical protein [Campylobacteraceae bacterium]
MIRILSNDEVYKHGKVIFTVHSGDILKILKKKICKNNKPCYKVKKINNNLIGYIDEENLNINHSLYYQK